MFSTAYLGTTLDLFYNEWLSSMADHGTPGVVQFYIHIYILLQLWLTNLTINTGIGTCMLIELWPALNFKSKSSMYEFIDVTDTR